MKNTGEKETKFERLAEKRVSDAIKKLRLIGNLSNKHNYSYTDEHVQQIIKALESEMQLLKGRFRDETDSKSFGFFFKTKKNEQ
jgi:uncharacterized protein YeeX (DUF496 family)